MIGVDWWIAPRREVEAELERLQAAGEPTTPEELNAYYRLPPGTQDTTRHWLAGIELLAIDDDAKELLREDPPPPGELWPAVAAAEDVLRRNEAALTEFHRAASLGGAARCPVDYSDGLATELPHLTPLREGWWLLRLQAYMHAYRGETDEAARTIHALFCLGRKQSKGQ